MDYQKQIVSFINSEKKRTSNNNASQKYEEAHQKRFKMIFAMCKRLVPSLDAQVLDIGRSSFTNLLSSYYKNVTSLGFPLGTTKNEGIKEDLETGRHIVFDLNDGAEVAKS